jgi:hypothetical protein
MTTLNETKRRPNLKKWICPIDGKVMNSRGAPAYLRNKFNIQWNKKFLRSPDLICKNSTYHWDNILYGKIAGLFTDIEASEAGLKNMTIDEIYKLIVRLRINLRTNDLARINQIHQQLFPITSSKIIIKRKQ